MKHRSLQKLVIIYLTVITATIISLFPFYWMLKSSLTPDNLMYTTDPVLRIQGFTLEHFRKLLIETQFVKNLLNSVYVALIASAIALIISIIGSYSMTRMRFKGRLALVRGIIFSYLLPASVLFIPMFVIVSKLGLANNKNSLLLVYQTIIIPYCCYMLMSYFKALPYSLEEAALIDGCGSLGALWWIILPLAAPGIAVVATFAFTLSWNEYLYALVLTTSPNQQTVTIGIASFRFSDQYIWGLLMSASVIASIPAVFLYLLSQKYLIGGLSAGGVKQ